MKAEGRNQAKMPLRRFLPSAFILLPFTGTSFAPLLIRDETEKYGRWAG
jgi:hypothetical protein